MSVSVFKMQTSNQINIVYQIFKMHTPLKWKKMMFRSALKNNNHTNKTDTGHCSDKPSSANNKKQITKTQNRNNNDIKVTILRHKSIMEPL